MYILILLLNLTEAWDNDVFFLSAAAVIAVPWRCISLWGNLFFFLYSSYDML